MLTLVLRNCEMNMLGAVPDSVRVSLLFWRACVVQRSYARNVAQVPASGGSEGIKLPAAPGCCRRPRLIPSLR